MKSDHFDLIIVGAGPVGSHLGYRVMKENPGKEVLIIERSDEIGKPLACSGHVSKDIWKFVPNDQRENLLQNKINEAIFHVDSFNKDNTYSFFREETISYAIDRVQLDKVKASQAEKKGVKIKTNANVVEVQENKEKVIVKTKEEEFTCNFLAGCDGASSTVRSELDLPEPGNFYQGILCFSEEEDSSSNVDVLLDTPDFFGWRIPRGSDVEYGVAVPPGKNPMKWLKKILEKYNVEKEENICAGGIPTRPPEKVSTQRCLLVGDAASQTKPFTGGGLVYGMMCSEIACENIDFKEDKILEYEKSWRDEIGQEILLGKQIENFYSYPSFIKKVVLRTFEGEIGVHMDKPSTLFSKEQLLSMIR